MIIVGFRKSEFVDKNTGDIKEGYYIYFEELADNTYGHIYSRGYLPGNVMNLYGITEETLKRVIDDQVNVVADVTRNKNFININNLYIV